MRLPLYLVALCAFSSQTILAIDQKGSIAPGCTQTSSLLPVSAESSAPRPLAICDLVGMREISEEEVRISPDGENVAFVVNRAVLETNNYESGIFVAKVAAGGPLRQLSSNVNPIATEPRRIDWSPDGRFVSYLSSQGGSSQVWLTDPSGGDSQQLTHHKGSIHNYRWAPDGHRIAFTTADVPSDSEISRIAARGVIYDGSVRLSQLRPETMVPEPEQLWIYDLRTRTERKLWEDTTVDVKAAWFGFYGDLYWSPDGTTIAALRRPVAESSWDKYDLVLISVENGTVEGLLDDVFIGDISWSPDGRQLAFVSSIDSMQRHDWDRLNVAIFTMDIARKDIVQRTSVLYWPERLWWSKIGDGIYFERRFDGHSALYKLSLSNHDQRISELSRSQNYLSDFSLDERQQRVACITENVSTPADIAVVDLRDGSVRTLANLHPEFKNLRLGAITKLEWTNKYGDSSFGYLVKPLDYVEGRHYPLVAVLYYFPGTFLGDSLGNYPIQVLAANGYAVLCVNVRNGAHPDTLRWYGPLDTLKMLTQRLVAEGIADPARKGIMGWSYGGEIVNVTVSHSDLFQVASAGEGAGVPDHDDYFLEDAPFQKAFLDRYVGGWPDGSAAKVWREVSPALNAQRVRAPLMLEAAESPYGALHYYTALKKRHKAVELVIYPDETHVFHQPDHLLSSMERNLDWFNFWLQNKEDLDPAKTDQYQRWRELRKLQEANQAQQSKQTESALPPR
jgi:dipeptidyl aminopeptidase/acylaminoacyl peptidase